jgi:hypothetical protein
MQHPNIQESLTQLDRWVESAEWKAYDTFDGLSSPLAWFCTFNHPLLKIAWQQGVRRFPLNLRPMLGIKPDMSTKGMGFFAQGYLRRYRTHGDPVFLEKAKYCLHWLIEHRNPQFKGYCWGNHFDYQSRGGNISKGTPTIVWTGLIAHAFLDAYEMLRDDRYLDVARSACEFILDELGWQEFPEGCLLRYYPNADILVHNSSMIGASLLGRVHSMEPNERYRDIADRAVHYTLHYQTAEGAWDYGVGKKWAWVDSFHTAYVLESLATFIRCTGAKQYAPALRKGYKFFVETFFGADGTPRYYAQRTLPIDIQCASQAIQTLVNLRDLHPESVATAINVAEWTIKHMQDKSGYFYYRKYPFITNKTATLHWGQATMFAALALLDQHLNADTPGVKAAAPSGGGWTRRTAVCQKHMNATLPTYALITPARNEEAFIELTLKSMVAQTVRPLKWVIVSDGSTDRTDEIVKQYTAQHDWIELVRMPERKERNFGGKVFSFNAGRERVKDLSYDIIGNLDADLSFDADMLEILMRKFGENPKLGVAGAPFTEGGGTYYDFRFSSVEHVSGACQLFRRECFDAIGGYTPIKTGGIDLVAVVSARMNGWQTRSIVERVCFHHKKMGSGMNRGWRLPFKWGQGDYRLGGHPAWQVFRCLYQMKRKPYLVFGLLCFVGYFYSLILRRPRAVTPEFAAFRGKEQLQRLRSFFRRVLSPGKAGQAGASGDFPGGAGVKVQ